MNYILKNYKTFSEVTNNHNGTLTMYIEIIVGIEGCQYDDIQSKRVAEYTFSEDLTAKQINEGVEPFALQWVAQNYINS